MQTTFFYILFKIIQWQQSQGLKEVENYGQVGKDTQIQINNLKKLQKASIAIIVIVFIGLTFEVIHYEWAVWWEEEYNQNKEHYMDRPFYKDHPEPCENVTGNYASDTIFWLIDHSL